MLKSKSRSPEISGIYIDKSPDSGYHRNILKSKVVDCAYENDGGKHGPWSDVTSLIIA
jgi:hypothetical protein